MSLMLNTRCLSSVVHGSNKTRSFFFFMQPHDTRKFLRLTQFHLLAARGARCLIVRYNAAESTSSHRVAEQVLHAMRKCGRQEQSELILSLFL